MNKRLVWGMAVAAALLFGACQTSDTAVSTPTVPPASEARVLEEMKAYLAQAEKKMDEIAVSEAVRQYVSVLALKSKLERPSRAALDLAAKAETELTKIESGFLLQAGPDWLAEDASQIVASTMAAAEGNVLGPTVTLWYNVGGSRIAVSAAPVVFEVVEGAAAVTGFATTNEYGEAAVPSPKIKNPREQIVVRASVKFTEKGYAHPFKQTKLDLMYRPPSKRAAILVFERDDQGKAMDNPYILDPVLGALKKMEFDFIPVNARPVGDDFMKAYEGDAQAVRKIIPDQNVPYLVMVLNDCYAIRQTIMDGKAYNIFKGEGKATLHIIRIADGKILFAADGYADEKHDNNAQNGTREKTVRDAHTIAAKELIQELGLRAKDINKALGLD